MEEITHFTGIVPDERWKNDVLNELREIRKLLARDSKTVQKEPVKQPEKQSGRTRRPIPTKESKIGGRKIVSRSK